MTLKTLNYNEKETLSLAKQAQSKQSGGESDGTHHLPPNLCQKDQLTLKAQERGLKLSLLCRLIVMRRKIPDHSPQTRRWLRDLIGALNNLNQLAHYANTIKGLDDWVKDALRFITSEVNKAKKILTYNNDTNNEQSI